MDQPSERESDILEKVLSILKRRLSSRRVILFGSRAKGRAGKGADFDLAVDSARPSLRIERKIAEEIEEVIGLYTVDIVYLESVDKEFRDIILKTGRVLYEKG